MSVLFSMGSILFGAMACILPLYVVKKRQTIAGSFRFSLYSFTSCAVSLCLLLFEIKHRASIGDWSAILDTIGAFCALGIVLIVLTVALNGFAMSIYKEEIQK